MSKSLVVLLVVCALYAAVGGRRLRGRRPLLQGTSAIAFELGEVLALCLLVWYAVRTHEYGFAAAFALAAAEHGRQLVMCERQA